MSYSYPSGSDAYSAAPHYSSQYDPSSSSSYSYGYDASNPGYNAASSTTAYNGYNGDSSAAYPSSTYSGVYSGTYDASSSYGDGSSYQASSSYGEHSAFDPSYSLNAASTYPAYSGDQSSYSYGYGDSSAGYTPNADSAHSAYDPYGGGSSGYQGGYNNSYTGYSSAYDQGYTQAYESSLGGGGYPAEDRSTPDSAATSALSSGISNLHVSPPAQQSSSQPVEKAPPSASTSSSASPFTNITNAQPPPKSNPFDKISSSSSASSTSSTLTRASSNPFDKIGGSSAAPAYVPPPAAEPARLTPQQEFHQRQRSASVSSGQFDSAKREKALQLGGVSTPCAECQKPVYLAEEIRVIGKVMHRLCFKCAMCKAPLSVSTFGSFDNTPYCKAHHIQVMRAAPLVKSINLSENMLKTMSAQRPQPHIHTETEDDDPDKGVGMAAAGAPFRSTSVTSDSTPQSAAAAGGDAKPSRPTAFEPDSNLQTQLPQKEPPEGVIQGLVVMLESPDLNTRAKAAAALCNITAASQKSVVSAADGTVIPQLVNMLKMPATQNARYLRAAAAGCLCNFAFNAENRAKINKAGAVPVLVSMLGPEDPFVSAHAAGALWSLLVGSDETKDLLADCGGFEPLVKMLQTGDVFAQSQAAGALSESCCKNARNKLLIGQSGAIPIILKLAVEGAPQLQRAAMLSLCNLLANCESNKTIAMKESALRLVISVLNRDDIGSETIAAALGTIVNLPSTEPNRKLAKQLKLKERVKQLQTNQSASVNRNAEKVLRWLK